MAFALGAPMVIGGAAMTVESGFHFWKHNHLQAVADSAAYAGAIEKLNGSSDTAIEGAATKVAKDNKWTETGNSITVNTPPASGAYTGEEAVEVLLTETEPRFFTAVFTSSPMVAKARAVALYSSASNACVLALNPTASRAIDVNGNATLTLNGCDIASNSKDEESMFVWGSSALVADCAQASGGIETKGNLTLKKCAKARANAPRLPDPYKNLEAPPEPAGTREVPKNPKGQETLEPGHYDDGMDLNGDFKLNPGVYYVSGGDFKVNSNSKVSGSGVTIYLASGSNVSINGGASLSLTAQTTGDYAGILFFGDRDGSGENKINGNASMSLTGHFYFPSQSVEFLGSFGGAAGCMHVIADTVLWKGNATLKVDCTSQGMTPIKAQQIVRIVE